MIKDDSVIPDSPSTASLESGQEAARTIFRNTTVMLGADAVVKLFGFIFNVYIVRRLGGEQFGLYSAAIAYVGIFSILADLGMTQYAIREIARGRRRADDFFWNLVIIRVILSVLATLLITASAAWVAGYQPDMVWGILIACFGFFLHALWGPVQIVLLAKERADYSSILATLIQIVFVVMGTIVLLSGYTYHGLIVASYLGVPLAAILGIIYIKKIKLATFHVHVTPQEWGSILKHGLPFAVITFTLVAATDLDTVLLSLWRSPEEVGWYKAAYNLIFKLLFVTGPLLATLGPQMSRHYGVSKDRVGQTYFSFFKFLFSLSLPIAVGTALLANQIIIWLYTEEFANSGLVLAILIWAFIPLNLSYLAGTVATSTDKEKQSAKVYALAALLNLSINAVVIPIWGYLGAAIATVITEVVAFVLFYSTLHSEFPLTDFKNTLVKPVLAGTVMGGVIYSLPLNWPIGLHIVMGAVVYMVVLFALKPFNQTELALIQGLWLGLRRRLKLGVS